MTKKMIFLAIWIVGSAVVPSGQAGMPYPLPTGQQISAQRIERTGSTSWRLRGAARIIQGPTIITADEVDAQTTSNGLTDFELRGNVHLTVNH